MAEYPLYFYPHGNELIFTGMTKMFLKHNYRYAWCLWRKLQNDTSFEYYQVVGDRYVYRDKRELSQEIMDSFESHDINYIMPARNMRIYMSFSNWSETYPYFGFMMDGESVAYKYRMSSSDFTDNWGLLT